MTELFKSYYCMRSADVSAKQHNVLSPYYWYTAENCACYLYL